MYHQNYWGGFRPPSPPGNYVHGKGNRIVCGRTNFYWNSKLLILRPLLREQNESLLVGRQFFCDKMIFNWKSKLLNSLAYFIYMSKMDLYWIWSAFWTDTPYVYTRFHRFNPIFLWSWIHRAMTSKNFAVFKPSLLPAHNPKSSNPQPYDFCIVLHPLSPAQAFTPNVQLSSLVWHHENSIFRIF